MSVTSPGSGPAAIHKHSRAAWAWLAILLRYSMTEQNLFDSIRRTLAARPIIGFSNLSDAFKTQARESKVDQVERLLQSYFQRQHRAFGTSARVLVDLSDGVSNIIDAHVVSSICLACFNAYDLQVDDPDAYSKAEELVAETIANAFRINGLDTRAKYDSAKDGMGSAFLAQHYHDVRGKLHTGHLAVHDPALLFALEKEAAASGRPLRDFVPPLEELIGRRSHLLAGILGMHPLDLTRPRVADMVTRYLRTNLQPDEGTWRDRVTPKQQQDHGRGQGPGSAANATATALPSEAPELWSGKTSKEDPAAFTIRVYGEWLRHGLTRAHLRKLDPKLYQAMATHVRRHGIPDELKELISPLSKRSRAIDQELADFGIQEPRDAFRVTQDGREARRLYAAARRRRDDHER